jgi:hypothetical protein
MARPLSAICVEIRKEWPKVNFAALPYLQAMESINSINDNYFCDSGKSIVLYFLANAQSFRGEAAKRIKLELNALAKAAR